MRKCAKIPSTMQPHKLLSIPLALLLILSACNVASIVQLIGQAVAIAEQAATVTGLVPPEYVAYVTAASNCLAFASTEEASTDSAALKGDKITAQCAMYATIALPPGTAANLVTLVSRLAVSIQSILATFPSSNGTRALQPGTKPATLSENDIAALNMLAGRARAASFTMKQRGKP